MSSDALQPIVTTDRQSQFITISPPEGVPVTASMIFLHGLGDTSQGWASAMYEVVNELPGLRCVLPTAPTQPVTMNGGYKMPSWYDIKGLDDRANEDNKGIEDSRSTVLSLIEIEKKKYGLTNSRIVIGGFSQGGAMSLYTGLQYSGDEGLGGVVCMSGYLPNAKQWKLSPISKSTPTLMCHGEADRVVQFWMAEKSLKTIKQAGLETVTWKTYRNLEHSANMEEIADVVSWLRSTLKL